MKNSDIFHISARNIDCGYSLEPPRRGGSNEYPQSMFLSRKKKNNVYPCKPQFYYIKVGLRGSKLYRHVFVMFRYFFLSYNYVLRLSCNCVFRSYDLISQLRFVVFIRAGWWVIFLSSAATDSSYLIYKSLVHVSWVNADVSGSIVLTLDVWNRQNIIQFSIYFLAVTVALCLWHWNYPLKR